MTEKNTPGRRPSGKPGSGRSNSGRPGSGRPSTGRPSSARPSSGKPGASRSGAPDERKPGPRKPGSERSAGRSAGGTERGRGSSARASGTEGGRSSFRSERPRRPRESEPEKSDAPRHDDPPVDADVTPKDLDRAAFRELTALTKENAEWVAGHLVMASRVIDDDPARAHRHAQAASRRAGRIAVVRETLGITAYVNGDYALALRELRTYRRLSGRIDQVPLMMDCERGLGRPQKALELAGEIDRAALPPAVQVEFAIARSGARLDLGQPDLALRELEIPYLTADKAYSFSPALFDSYAVVLAELGRHEEAASWGKRADRAAQLLAEHGGAEDETVVVVEVEEEEQ